jgi:hypothetical protein
MSRHAFSCRGGGGGGGGGGRRRRRRRRKKQNVSDSIQTTTTTTKRGRKEEEQKFHTLNQQRELSTRQHCPAHGVFPSPSDETTMVLAKQRTHD